MSYTPAQESYLELSAIEKVVPLGKIQAMVGAFNVVRQRNGINFRFKGSRKMNCCKVEFTPDDMLKITFLKIKPRTFEIDTIEVVDHLFASEGKFIEVFERVTGLRLKL